MSILRLSGIRREIGTFVILDAIDASIALGDRIGLVGPNGAGKTTLLRIAAGLDEPDAGEVGRKRGLSLGLLAQEAHLDAAFMAARTLRDAVRRGAANVERMGAELERMEKAGLVTDPAYADLQHRFETLGGYTLEQRLDATLSGLGFTADEIRRSPSSLSGGEQTRAALARLVIADPDLLLLDEPTNHLDLGALEWLEDHLRRRDGSLLVASHDRAFLDATVTRIWELRDRKLTVFRGDYSAYHRQRRERDERAERDAETHEAAIAREVELVQRYRSHRKHVKMHEHEARLERLREERVEAPRQGRKLRLPGAALLGGGPSRSGEIVLRVDDLVVGYLPGRSDRLVDLAPVHADGDVDDDSVARTGIPGEMGGADGDVTATPPATPLTEPKPVARAPFLAARRGDRIGIVGPNGAGKTTLLRTIAGELPALDGAIAFGSGTQLGYLAQLRAAAFPGATVLDALLDAVPVTPGEGRGYLARFLFRGDDVFKEVRLLSGGERSRLELALLGIMPSNLLLLDEPTNHLDVGAREAIEEFLAESPATILVVSHDRRFLDTICERLWVVDRGLVAPFEGGYRAWREAVAGGWTVEAAIEQESRRLRPTAGGRNARPAATALGGNGRSGTNGARRPATGTAATAPAKAAASRDRRGGSGESDAQARVAAPARPRLPKLSKEAYRRQRVAIDAELTRLGLRKNHLELALGDPSVQANFVELRRVASELADVETALSTAEDEWLALEERAP
jgi:ATP-binding cassette subfamily F protein 3